MQHQRVQHALVRPGLTGNQPPAAGARDVGGSGGPSPSCMEVRHADRAPAIPAGRSRAGPRQHPLRRPRQPTAARPDRPRRDRPARARLAGHAMVTARDERSRHDGKPGSRRPGASAPRRRGRTPGPVREASTRHTRAVQMALAGAAQPVRFDRLAAQLATQLPHVDRCKIETMLDGAAEIRLTDADIEALTVGDPEAVIAPPRIELGVAVDAACAEALDRGDFELRVTGAPRAYTSMAGRFAYLLDAADRDQLAHTYAPAAGDRDVVAVQLSFPPRRVHNENVVRVGRLVTEVVSLSEHPDGDVISVDDLAVTADADQLYLVRRSTGQRVIPRIPHALDTTVQTPPLVRFIAEVADARSAVFGPLDLGAAARTLPYAPRIRYRRTVLAPARWFMTANDLSRACGTVGTNVPHGAHRDGDDQWDNAFGRWRRRWQVPARVIVCHGELRLPLDFDQPVDRALLRTRLARADRLEVREDGPADGHGWLGRPAEFTIPMTLTTPTARRLPVTAPPGPTHRPGDSAVVHARLIGNPARFDELLAGHLPTLGSTLTGVGVVQWWMGRHRDVIRLDADQYVSVFFRLEDPAAYGVVAVRLAEFAAGLHSRGLPSELALAAYHEHPARYGDGPALAAAEQVFAADTTAAITQLRLAEQAGISGQALAAASMAHLAAGFAADPAAGYRALLACLKRHTEPADRILSDLARDLVDPCGEFRGLRALPGGDAVAAAWQARHTARWGLTRSSSGRPATWPEQRPCAALPRRGSDDRRHADDAHAGRGRRAIA